MKPRLLTPGGMPLLQQIVPSTMAQKDSTEMAPGDPWFMPLVVPSHAEVLTVRNNVI